MRARRPMSASRTGSAANGARRPLPDRSGSVADPWVSDTGQSHSGPGMMRDFMPDSKYPWDDTEHQDAFQMAAGTERSGRHAVTGAFRAAEASKFNEKRHNWMKGPDSFQTPPAAGGHLCDVEDLPEASSSPCHFHSQWLGVLYKEVMNGVSRYFSAELVLLKEDLRKEFDSVKAHTDDTHRSTCEYLDKVISSRTTDLKPELEVLGDRLGESSQQSTRKILESIMHLNKEASQHNMRVDGALQQVCSGSNDMGISLAKEVGALERSIESSRDQIRVAISDAVESLTRFVSSSNCNGEATATSPSVASRNDETLASLKTSVDEAVALVRALHAQDRSVGTTAHVDLEPLSMALSKSTMEVKSGLDELSNLICNRMHEKEMQICLTELSALVRGMASDIKSGQLAPPAPPPPTELATAEREELLTVMQGIRDDMGQSDVKQRLSDVHEVCNSIKESLKFDDVLAGIADESKSIQGKLDGAVKSINSSRHDLDPLWVCIRSSTEQIGMVMTEKFQRLEEGLSLENSRSISEAKGELLAALQEPSASRATSFASAKEEDYVHRVEPRLSELLSLLREMSISKDGSKKVVPDVPDNEKVVPDTVDDEEATAASPATEEATA